MKRTTFLLSFLLFLLYSAKGQYLPLLSDSSRYWQQNFWTANAGSAPPCSINGQCEIQSNYTLVVKGKKYKKLYVSKTNFGSSNPCFGALSYAVTGYLREDTLQKKVYKLSEDSSEYVLYNFDKKVNDTLQVYPVWPTSGPKSLVTVTVTAIDTTLALDGKIHRVFHFSSGTLLSVIEGIGATTGILTPDYGNHFFEAGVYLNCVGSMQQHKYIYGSCDTLLGSKKIAIHQAIQLYPNPVSELLTIDHPDLRLINTYMEVYNLLGQKQVISGNQQYDSNKLNVSSLEQGIYMLKIVSVNGCSTSIFVKD
jgi:hypothetical protein